MARFRFTLPLLAAVLVGGALAPRPAAAGSFAPQWSLTGWNYVTNFGDIDGDSKPELLFSNAVDGHYALVDGTNGTIQQEFPEFAYPNSGAGPIDVDDDGTVELMFWGQSGGPAPCKVYEWNGVSFALLFQHNEGFNGAAMYHVRSASQRDLVEFAQDEIRIRNAAGTVIWRTTDLGPGLGAFAFGYPVDLTNDGIDELLVVGQDASFHCHMVKWTGATFLSQWNVTGWVPQLTASTENSPAIQVAMLSFADGHFGMFEGVTGAQVGDFPGISGFDGGTIVPIQLNPVGGRTELLVWQPPVTGLPAVAPKFRIYRWGGAGYDLFLSHTDPVSYFSWASFRSPSATEFVEVDVDAGDVRIRDDGNNVLFRASTDIPGWAVGPKPALNAGAIDLLHDGSIPRLIIDEYPNATRLVSYAGTFSQTWAAHGWHFGGALAGLDADPQDEIVLVNASDQTFAFVDGLTGSQMFHPTAWTQANSAFDAYDADNDGRKELVFHRVNVSPGDPAPLMEQFRWDGSAYQSMFQVTDSLIGLAPVQMRGPAHHELFQASPSGDVTFRDGITGQQVFRASTDLVGWIPLDLYGSTPLRFGEFDGDGLTEMLIDSGPNRILLGYTGPTSVLGPGSGVALQLLPNVPNPFRNATTLRFVLPVAGRVDVRIFDTAGRLVRQLDRFLPAGLNAIEWDGRDEAGNRAPNGVLFYEVAAGGMRQTGKVVRVR